MTEHVHEWRIDWFTNRIFCPYKKCQKELTNKEIMRRLNATEKLSAEDAREIAIETHSAWWPLEGESPYEDGLRAYASALEGENEKS